MSKIKFSEYNKKFAEKEGDLLDKDILELLLEGKEESPGTPKESASCYTRNSSNHHTITTLKSSFST
jgi:hypothetical protein